MRIYTKDVIKEKKARSYKIHIFINNLFIPIMAILLVLCVYIVFQKVILKKSKIDIFGYSSYIVLTGSMEPVISPNDMVICKVPNSSSEINKGDIITFYLGNESESITHRVINVITKNGEKYYQTKGDHNNSIDSELISYKNIQGVYCFKISKIGWLLTKCLTGTGLIVVFLLLVIGYHNSSVKEDRRLTREEARKKYNICKYKKYGENVNENI